MNCNVMSACGVVDRIGGEFGVGDVYVNKYKMFHCLRLGLYRTGLSFLLYKRTPGRVVTY